MEINKTMEHERRKLQRVSDHVALTYREISSDELDLKIENHDKLRLRLSLRSIFEHEKRQHASLTKPILENQPDVARYLGYLDKQLELLANVLLPVIDTDLNAPNYHVDITTTGLGFVTGKPLPVDTSLEVRLRLFPSRILLVIYGAVAYCDPAQKASTHKLGIDFLYLHDQDREYLAQHILALNHKP